MNINFIGYCTYALFIIPYIYFLNRFLVPRYKKTTLYAACTFAIWVYIIIAFFFEQFFLRPILLLVAFYSCACLFYNGTIAKKVACPFILMASMGLAEGPIDYVNYIILGNNPMALMEGANNVIPSIVVNIFIFLILYFLLRIMKKNSQISIAYPSLFIILCVCFFSVVTFVIQVQGVMIIEISQQEMFMKCIFIFVTLLIILASSFLLLYFLHRLYRKTKLELSMEKLAYEYRLVLDEYMSSNGEMSRYLKHDIMNQLLQQKRMKEKEDEANNCIL